MNDFADNSDENGLLLIDTPTASGKSHSAANFIFDQHQKHPERCIYYLTTLKSNVNDFLVKETKKAFEKNGQQQEFENATLKIESNFDSVVNKLSQSSFVEELKTGNCKEFVRLKEFSDLKDVVDIYCQFKKSGQLRLADNYQSSVFQAEFAFRQKLTELIRTKAKTVDGRINKILSDYKELTQLYPAILTKKHTLFFLTIDKFYLGNNTIVEPSYRFVDRLQKGSIIIIDEIDSAKESILRQQIDECNNHKIDSVSFLSRIEETLEAKKFPTKMLKELPPKSEGQPESKKHITSQEAFDAIKDFVPKTYKENHLNYFIKLSPDFDDNAYPLIFHDEENFTIGDDKRKKISIEFNNEEACNFIHQSEKMPDGELPLNKMLFSLNGAIQSYINEAQIISYNYMRFANEERKGTKDLLDSSSAASTILKAFGLSNEDVRALEGKVGGITFSSTQSKQKEETSDGLLYSDFYKDGFSFFTFKDDDSNDLMTDIVLTQLNETPEFFLYRIASIAKVIGLSATCLIDSPLSNFDLQYLEDKLGNHFKKLTDEDRERMKFNFLNFRQRNNLADISTMECDCPSLQVKEGAVDKSQEIESIAKYFFTNEDLKGWFADMLKSADHFDAEQFVKLAKAIYSFYKNPRLQTLLIMRNPNLDSQTAFLYTQKNIEQFVECLGKDDGSTPHSAKVISLKSNTFFAGKAEIQEAFNNHIEKILICSSYPSASIGQNLQLELESDEEDDSKVLLEKGKKEKDLDAIYLESPTNIIVNTSNKQSKLDTSDLIKAIYQYEVIKRKDGISSEDFFLNIKQAVKKTNIISAKAGIETSTSNYKSLYDKPSVSKAALKVIEQAVGRICRTVNKPCDSEVAIFYDSKISKLNFDIFDGKILNKEFQALVDKIRNMGLNKTEKTDSTRIVENDCRIIQTNIRSLLSETGESWTDQQMSDWNQIRTELIHNPTISEEQYQQLSRGHKPFYIKCINGKSNKYWFVKKNNDDNIDYEIDDFTNLKISFEEIKKTFEVSEDDCKLSILRKIDFVQKAMLSKGIPDSFKENDYILSPVAYNNIYKGALGEFITCVFFQLIGKTLISINDGKKFEKFDYVLENNPNVYVDAKLWGARANFYSIGYIDKVRNKLHKIGGKKAIVVNVIGIYDKGPSNDGEILTIPSIFEKDESGNYSISIKVEQSIRDFLDGEKS